jgi:hypothetical protein
MFQTDDNRFLFSRRLLLRRDESIEHSAKALINLLLVGKRLETGG